MMRDLRLHLFIPSNGGETACGRRDRLAIRRSTTAREHVKCPTCNRYLINLFAKENSPMTDPNVPVNRHALIRAGISDLIPDCPVHGPFKEDTINARS